MHVVGYQRHSGIGPLVRWHSTIGPVEFYRPAIKCDEKGQPLPRTYADPEGLLARENGEVDLDDPVRAKRVTEFHALSGTSASLKTERNKIIHK